ncbi:hypothetical protein [Paenibacillus cymbidii]|uniref:hypothetical protein n=1 Tax=Paenibacillus cymbidii TaxID=1639034 RepID=UPI0010815A02|nr:hypothetical protein [Paenibacillus cymbidii]
MGKWLFFDSSRLEEHRNIEFMMHQPQKAAHAPIYCSNQVLDMPVSLHYDEEEQQFKLWYMENNADKTVVLTYWTSADGLRWERPPLHLFGEADPCNTVMKGTGQQGTYGVFSLHRVIVDKQEKDPGKKYKMLYWDKPRLTPSGALAAFSPDGIHWVKHDEDRALFGGHDAFNLMQDADTGQYRCYQVLTQRREPQSFTATDNMPGFKRLVHVRTSGDFATWSGERLLFDTDGDDPEDMQHYFFQVTRYEGLYLGYLTAYYSGEQKGDTKLYYSNDGYSWNKTHGRASFLPHGADGEWDSCWASLIQDPIRLNGNLIFYYHGVNKPHNWISWKLDETKFLHSHLGWYTNELAKVDNLAVIAQDRMHALVNDLQELIGERLNREEKSFIRGFGLAVLREDGYVSVRSRGKEGMFVTEPVTLSGRIAVNCDCSGGWISVGLQDESGNWIEGYEPERCVIERQDGTELVLRWNEDGKLPERSGPVKLLVRLSNCDLYSISL